VTWPVTWVDVAARARGLGTHALAAEEAAAVRRAGEELAILVRWADDRAGALAVFVDDEDRRSLRALLRGLAAAVPADRRLAAATPTPGLSAPALRELAEAASPAGFAQALARRRHPFAAALAAPLARTPLDLVEVELALARRFAERARRARGGRGLAIHVAQVIDVDHLEAALLLAERGRELDAARAFSPGGARLGRDAFLAAARAEPVLARRALAGTPLAAAVHAPAPDAIEEAALAWHLATQRRLARIEPEGLAPVLALLLRRRQEIRAIRRAAWQLALGGAG
jgi:vacuolar-type H+-ATPase subunit C/Vma6